MRYKKNAKWSLENLRLNLKKGLRLTKHLKEEIKRLNFFLFGRVRQTIS
jgi:hypothetical protein